MTAEARADDRRGRILLLVGAALGAALSAYGIAARRAPAPTVPPGAVAVVDAAVISRADLDRALAAVASDRRAGRLTADDPTRVLDRLIDEELLVQRALELGLAARDPAIRAQLSGAMIDVIAARGHAQAGAATDAELRAFYDENAAFFRRAPALRVEAATYRGPEALARARAAHAALSGGAGWGEVASADRSAAGD